MFSAKGFLEMKLVGIWIGRIWKPSEVPFSKVRAETPHNHAETAMILSNFRLSKLGLREEDPHPQDKIQSEDFAKVTRPLTYKTPPCKCMLCTRGNATAKPRCLQELSCPKNLVLPRPPPPCLKRKTFTKSVQNPQH